MRVPPAGGEHRVAVDQRQVVVGEEVVRPPGDRGRGGQPPEGGGRVGVERGGAAGGVAGVVFVGEDEEVLVRPEEVGLGGFEGGPEGGVSGGCSAGGCVMVRMGEGRD